MLGYETNYAKDNQAFSRAYLFNFLPFYHAGVRVSLPVHPRFTVLYMLTNGVQQTEDFNDFKSSHVAAVLKPIDAVTWTVNYYRGQEQPDGGAPGGPDGRFTVLDTYLTAAPTSALTLGFDINYTANQVTRHDSPHSLSGLGVYARYQLTSPTALGVRFERLDDEGLFGAIQQTLNEITLTAEHRLGEGVLVRAEWRRDGSDHPFFPGPAGAADLRRRQPTFLVGGVWVLGTKKGAW